MKNFRRLQTLKTLQPLKQLKILLFLLIVATGIQGQTVELQSLPMAGKQAKLYYFTGAKTDSLLTTMNTSGKAVFTIPDGDYKGMAALIIPGAGGIEMVVAENNVTVQCNTDNLSNETAVFHQSKENAFLSRIFKTQTLHLQQKAWLEAGRQIFGDSPLVSQLQPELMKVNSAMADLEMEITASKLYAARYYRLADFMNRLFDTEQKRDRKGAKLIQQEMEESLDIAALYSSGRLWESSLNFYISLFNHTRNDGVKQQEYAASVLKTTERLSAPYFEAFLAGCITETERFGWRDVQNEIVGGLLSRYQGFTSSYPTLQRAIGAYRVNAGMTLPPIVGLTKTKDTYSKILIVFHDSDCGTCVNEMTRLMQLYPELKEKGIRVVSVAADTDKQKFEEASSRFPWPDKLCDFEGFTGENFSNYNVIGSPSFYLTDTEGKLLGMYFSVADIDLGNEK